MAPGNASLVVFLSLVLTVFCWPQVYNLSGQSAEFGQFLEDPSIPKNKKVPALNAILDKMEVSDVTKHFLGEIQVTGTKPNLLLLLLLITKLCVHRRSSNKQQAKTLVQHQRSV